MRIYLDDDSAAPLLARLLRFVSLQVLSGCVSYSRWFALIILVWGRERTVRDDPSAG